MSVLDMTRVKFGVSLLLGEEEKIEEYKAFLFYSGWKMLGKEKTAYAGGWGGNVLFSRRAAPVVSSELKGLTAVFGMGTGVSPSL